MKWIWPKTAFNSTACLATLRRRELAEGSLDRLEPDLRHLLLSARVRMDSIPHISMSIETCPLVNNNNGRVARRMSCCPAVEFRVQILVAFLRRRRSNWDDLCEISPVTNLTLVHTGMKEDGDYSG
jgi:hypothetical protein